MSVNVAVRNLLEENFVESIEQALFDTASDPAHLHIEVTETGAMLDTLRVIWPGTTEGGSGTQGETGFLEPPTYAMVS